MTTITRTTFVVLLLFAATMMPQGSVLGDVRKPHPVIVFNIGSSGIAPPTYTCVVHANGEWVRHKGLGSKPKKGKLTGGQLDLLKKKLIATGLLDAKSDSIPKHETGATISAELNGKRIRIRVKEDKEIAPRVRMLLDDIKDVGEERPAVSNDR